MKLSFLSKLRIPFQNITISLFFLNLATALIILVIQRSLPPQVPLFYGMPKGEEQLVKKIFLILPALAAEIVLVINLIIINFTKDNFSQRAILCLTIVTTALAIITTFKIIFLVGSF